MYRDKQFVVIGLGKFGTAIVETLCENNVSVLACDCDPARVKAISEIATYAVEVDATDEKAMESVGLKNFDVAIIAIGSDFESTLIATMIAKEQGVDYVIAKAVDSRQELILKNIGANRVILPEIEMGVKLATTLITTNVIEFINLSKQYGLAEINPLPQWIGKTLVQANVRAIHGINIVAIKRGKKIHVSLKADDAIEKDDILVVIGETSDISRVNQ